MRWKRPPRAVAVVVALAVGSAAGTWWAGRGIRSPDQAARNASAPAASPITVPVERRQLTTAVVVRGDAGYAQATEVSVADLGGASTGEGGAQVVTGRVPAPGAQLAEGNVAVEVSGRPLFLLAGRLPMYRALGPGTVGADVRQLEQALNRLGFLAGNPDSTYDQQTAAAVTRLYRDAGYPPPGPSTADAERLSAAEARVRAATAAVQQAETALAQVRRPPARSAVLTAQGAVDQAQAALVTAKSARDAAVAARAEAPTVAAREAEVTAAANRLAVAEAQLAELTTARDDRAQVRAASDARAQLATARSARAAAQKSVGARVPRGEVVFVASLPLRVDKVLAGLGKPATGPVLRLTSAEVQVESALSAAERKVVTAGMPVRLDDDAGGTLAGTVAAVADTPGTAGAPAGSYHLRVKLAGTGLARFAGLNLRVTIPIRSTAGEVLAVPQAALVTNAGGAVRVRVARNGGFADVPVTVGLAADGFAEVRPAAGQLNAGELVVVGSRL